MVLKVFEPFKFYRIFCIGGRPLWIRPFISAAWMNPVRNMRDMEMYLQENCSDLDTTAVKIFIGKGQDETGTAGHFS